jgi:hypothetical protein
VLYRDVVELDRLVYWLARGQGQLQYLVGCGFSALGTTYQELGFATLDGYAKERCSVTGRWAERAGAAARRLQSLPLIRDAFISGKVSWSMVEVFARRAEPETEAELLSWASDETVRAVKAAFKARDEEAKLARLEAKVDAEDERAAASGHRSLEELAEQPMTSLSVTMGKRELLLLESTRMLAQLMNGSESTEQWVDGLLAEAQETMQRKLGRERAHLFEVASLSMVCRACFSGDHGCGCGGRLSLEYARQL